MVTIIFKGILEKAGVRVRVPVASPDMVPVTKKKIFDSDEALHYWQRHLRFGQGLVTMRFFGLKKEDLGKNICAKVGVSEHTEKGRSFLMVFVHKTRGQSHFHLRFPTFENGESVPIYMSRHYICFVPIKGRQSPVVLEAKPKKPSEDLYAPRASRPQSVEHSLWQRILEALRRFLGIAPKPVFGA